MEGERMTHHQLSARNCNVPSLEYAIEELFEHFGVDVDFRHEQ